jgi:hypothetical protein
LPQLKFKFSVESDGFTSRKRLTIASSHWPAAQREAVLGLSITKLIIDMSDGPGFFDKTVGHRAKCCIDLPLFHRQ